MPERNLVRDSENCDFDFDFYLHDDPMAAARGLRNGLFFSAILWALIGLVIWAAT